MKLAISDGLGIVPRAIHLRNDRLVTVIHALASAQRVAAVEEQSGVLRAQLAQGLGDSPPVVQVRGVINPDHDARASSTAYLAHRSSASVGPKASRILTN